MSLASPEALPEALPAWARCCEALGTNDNRGSSRALEELENGLPSFFSSISI